MPAGAAADEEAARLSVAAEHTSGPESPFHPSLRFAVSRAAPQRTLAAANPQGGVVLLLTTLISTFFAVLAPVLHPRPLRLAVQSAYAVLAATTILLLTITTCDPS